MSALGQKADIAACLSDVRFTPESGLDRWLPNVCFVPKADICPKFPLKFEPYAEAASSLQSGARSATYRHQSWTLPALRRRTGMESECW